jgi:transposase
MSKSSRQKIANKSSVATKKNSPITKNMPVINEHAAGIDIAGSGYHFVAVEANGEVEVRKFGGNTDDLIELVGYLLNNNITTVAMESTGVYWEVIYNLMEEAGIEVYLVNPTHVKNVPGRRKDDKSDSRWIQKLHKFGLLSASFRPQLEDRVLHSLHRQRVKLVQLSSDELRRMQKALDLMNVRVHKAISTINSNTGMNIIRAIVDGEHNPKILAKMRDSRCKCSNEELEAALTGYYLPHQILALKHALERYDYLKKQIDEIDAAIEETLRKLIPLSEEVIKEEMAKAPKQPKKRANEPSFNFMVYNTLLVGKDPTVLPGISVQSAMGLLCELGRDFDKWPTAKHFASYLTLAPVQKISGGKLLKSATRAGAPPAAVIFKQAAATIMRTDTALGAYCRKLAIRKGSGKAVTATARKLSEQYYNLMKYGKEYIDKGAEEYEMIHQQKQLVGLKKMAAKLNMTVIPNL